jgi:ATP-dependent RNA helicase DeaD
MLSNSTPAEGFSALALTQPILNALESVGYDTPSPIQSQTIPHLLEGKDVLGTAQTGTGKTAAFALPLLSRIDLSVKAPQVMVLAPTRELAIQVAESFKRYASFMKGFEVLPIYGGQDYGSQIKQLKKGVHVVVGTPGRVMDHMRRGTLKLDNINAMVLDEADEMLRMGFIDDVEWVLDQTPKEKQIALFSATMPPQIRRIATTYLRQPEEINIKRKENTADTITQRMLLMNKGINKFEALSRILEAEDYDGMIIFVRTKNNTVELADDLQKQGHKVAALNGDMAQAQRERTVDQLKNGKLDILIATDVVARGLDVKRISHVINYDIPFNAEAYVHRIGRTGRAGRTGDAILFVNNRERHLLRDIERTTKKQIEPMELPSVKQINEQRISKFQNAIVAANSHKDKSFYVDLLKDLQEEKDMSIEDIAASLAVMLHKDAPLLLVEKPFKARSNDRSNTGNKKFEGKKFEGRKFEGRKSEGQKPKALRTRTPEEGMQRYRLEVGKNDGVKPGNIVGALANEAGLESEFIKQVSIHESYSTVDLPEGMPKAIQKDLRKVWVCGKQLNISIINGSYEDSAPKKRKILKTKSKKHN